MKRIITFFVFICTAGTSIADIIAYKQPTSERPHTIIKGIFLDDFVSSEKWGETDPTLYIEVKGKKNFEYISTRKPYSDLWKHSKGKKEITLRIPIGVSIRIVPTVWRADQSGRLWSWEGDLGVIRPKENKIYSFVFYLEKDEKGSLYSNAKWISKSMISPLNFNDMVLIPAGEFDMGSKEGLKQDKPVHTVLLDAFYIDKYEVTVAKYRTCVDSGRCGVPKSEDGYEWGTKQNHQYNWGKKNRENHPINGIDWYDAKAYCLFVGKNLPTEAQWEKAASWRDGRKYKYPSGKPDVSCQDAVMLKSSDSGCGKNMTWPVGSKPIEINGTYDMCGNVFEWVSDWYGPYSVVYQKNPKGPKTGSKHVVRGGSMTYSDGLILSGTSRYGTAEPTNRDYDTGFRCARLAE